MTGRVERIEGGARVLILLTVAGMAGAASFTHVHDWTMANSRTGTPGWFGWANAVVSELVPLGVGLEVRRRRRRGAPIGRYPILIITAAVALSLAGQLAQARPSISGWLLAAVPALGFLALVKLVLSRPTDPTQSAADPAPDSDVGIPSVAVTAVEQTPLARVNGYAIGSGVAR
jgi:peptidoglycan/LPS O-acetylase OafA/YrhL